MEPSELFKDHTDPNSECIDGLTGTCLSKIGESKLKEYINDSTKDSMEAMELAKDKSGCKNNKCVAKLLFNDYINKPKNEQKQEELEQLKEDVETHFKPSGPYNSNKWLSNIDIETILNSWAHIYYKECVIFPFCMMDFQKTDELFNKIDIEKVKKDKLKSFCVFNTDFSTGTGKHWVCVCVDGSQDTPVIEYFDSGGNPPPKELYSKLLDLSLKFKVDIKFSTVKHQKENTECGVYCLFFIDKRLRNYPYDYFLDKRISDENMKIFRKYLFSSI